MSSHFPPGVKGAFRVIMALVEGIWAVIGDRSRSLREILDTNVWSLAPDFEIITIEFYTYIMAPLSASWTENVN